MSQKLTYSRKLHTTCFGSSQVSVDNNTAGRALCTVAVGRKGWLFSDTVKGAIASANLYSLVETAKANGAEPYAYLSMVLDRLPYAKCVEDFEALLPWNMKLSQARHVT
jgi:transposase